MQWLVDWYFYWEMKTIRAREESAARIKQFETEVKAGLHAKK